MATTKHVPVRQCVACRLRRPKRELLRIVLGEAGAALDPTGRRPGRGAYVCPDRPECWAEKKLRRFAGAKAAELSGALQTVLAAGGGAASSGAATGGAAQDAPQDGPAGAGQPAISPKPSRTGGGNGPKNGRPA